MVRSFANGALDCRVDSQHRGKALPIEHFKATIRRVEDEALADRNLQANTASSNPHAPMIDPEAWLDLQFSDFCFRWHGIWSRMTTGVYRHLL